MLEQGRALDLAALPAQTVAPTSVGLARLLAALEHAWDLSILFASDGQVTAAEWAWGLTALKSNGCLLCMRALLAAPGRGAEGPGGRPLQDLPRARAGARPGLPRAPRAEAAAAGAAAPRLGVLVAPRRALLSREERGGRRLLRRAAQALAAEEPACSSLEGQLARLGKALGDPAALGARV